VNAGALSLRASRYSSGDAARICRVPSSRGARRRSGPRLDSTISARVSSQLQRPNAYELLSVAPPSATTLWRKK
jgi:hypothetical protein